MAIRIGAALIRNMMLGTSQVQNVFLGTVQVWASEVVVVLGNANSIVLVSYFTAAQWANATLKKRVVVPAGVIIGATNATYAIASANTADGQAGSWAGSLTLEIRGTVQGIGGVANSGVGGSVIWCNLPGRNGEKLNIVYFAGCIVRAGGGGGGRAGNGGTGVWYSGRTVTEGPFYTYRPAGTNSGYAWIEGYDSGIWWGPRLGYPLSNPTVIGSWTYYRGQFRNSWAGDDGDPSSAYEVSRQTTAYDVPNYTSGGIAGNAGRGEGHDGPALAGANPVAGGTNAGASGKSGNGGAYGNSGQTGANGSSGNYSVGTAGAAGGLTGFYLHGAANANETINGGSLLGRRAA